MFGLGYGCFDEPRCVVSVSVYFEAMTVLMDEVLTGIIDVLVD